MFQWRRLHVANASHCRAASVAGSVAIVGESRDAVFELERDAVRGEADRVVPVSYTHLDVYKRQITTPVGTFNVWTKRIGNNPALKVLLLHGGPGATHDYFEAFDSFFPAAGIEYYYYDQLGSGRSDNPDDSSMWDVNRFVDEVEQVRSALDLGPDNFVLLGQSWGGILAMEYALAHGEEPVSYTHLDVYKRQTLYAEFGAFYTGLVGTLDEVLDATLA